MSKKLKKLNSNSIMRIAQQLGKAGIQIAPKKKGFSKIGNSKKGKLEIKE
ncbi:hypothetical protein [Paenibacillus tepidiphilus]|nr:hypothetical protein [Paenibacillus tepidiphilus]